MSGTSKADNTNVPDDTTPFVDLMAMEEGLTPLADVLREVRIINTWALIAELDPAKALAQIEKAGEMHWAAPPLLPALHDALLDLMQRRVADANGGRADFNEVPSARAEVGRCEAFRADPGAFVPGAVHAKGLAAIGTAAVDGFLDVHGEICPWVYSAVGVGKMGVWELGMMMSEMGFARGYILGTHVRDGAVIPDGITYVEVR